MNQLLQQIWRFGIVGGISFSVDFSIMVFLTELVGLNYLLSCFISASTSITLNYFMTIQYVFSSRDDLRKNVEFTIYAILSIIGLGLTEFFMWIGVGVLGIHYMITKVFVTGIVMVYNFISRKLFLEGNKSTVVDTAEGHRA